MADQAAAWREPARELPLRWGGYGGRYSAAIGLILAGGLLVQAASVYAGYLLVGGLAAHIAGWIILPARGPRRVAIALPSALAVGSLLFGSAGSILLVIPLVGWLYLRQRPAIAYLVTVLPVLAGLVLSQLYPQYGHGAIVVAVATLVLVASAWLGRSIAKSRPISSQSRVKVR
ncbi:hypothetical protein [Lacisediminihabitans sp.]|uniref:hypothetical protein n=1 Tax=Lacisediminihabitans sp. TaxID=2787631 RepID=UPI00374D4FD2